MQDGMTASCGQLIGFRKRHDFTNGPHMTHYQGKWGGHGNSALNQPMTNLELYDRAEKAISDLFSDQSVTQREAKANLRGLVDHLEILIDTLEGDEDDEDE